MNKRFCRVAPMLFACALAGAAWAQEKPAQPVARASMASIDDFNKFLADIGVPMIPELQIKEHLETLPFIGPGGIVTSKPLGVTIIAGDPHKFFPFEDSFVVSVPVAAGRAMPADLTAAGGTPIEGTTDSFKTNAGNMRRTGDYLHARPDTGIFGLSAMNNAPFASDYKDAGTLFAAVADLAALRQAAPTAYQDFAKEITALPRMIGIGTPDDAKPVTGVLDKIDTLALALGQDSANFDIKGALSPSPLPGKALDVPRPAFPAGMIVRMHLAYPTPESAAFLEKQLTLLSEDNFGMGMPPVYHQRAKDLVLQIVSFNSRASAVSLAVAMKDGKPVVYLVDQFNTDVDALKETADIVNEASGLAQEGAGQKIDVQAATYADGAQKVQRLTLTPDAAAGAPPDAKVVIDEIQVGRTLYATLSLADGKSVAALAGAGMDGKSTMIFAGDLDLGALIGAMPDSGVLMLPREVVQSLKTSWAGQHVSWTVQSTPDNVLNTDLQLPRQAVRDLLKLGGVTQERPAPEQPAAPARPVQPGLP